jgi:hypothetical protein
MAISFAVPCFRMGFQMLAVWRNPMAYENGRWVQLGVGVFVLEFILLHAGVMIGGASMDASGGVAMVGILGLIAFYTVFAVAIAYGFKSRMLFMSFLSLVVGRFVGLMIGMTAADKQLFLAHSLVAMALYFVLVFASVLLPWPRLGITAEVAAQTRAPHAAGQWEEKPHTAIGPATVYFLLLGIIELTLMTWIDPRVITFK